MNFLAGVRALPFPDFFRVSFPENFMNPASGPSGVGWEICYTQYSMHLYNILFSSFRLFHIFV